MSNVIVGERYRRKDDPRAFVWVVSADGQSVGYRHPGGLASIPEDQFLQTFEHAPKRARKR